MTSTRRRAAGLPSFIAIPIALAAAALWARGYVVQDSVRFGRGGTDVQLVGAPGRLVIHTHPQTVRHNRGPAWDTAPAPEGFSPGNLLHKPAYRAAPGGGSTATVPYWLPVLIGLIPPAWWGTSTRRRRRRNRRLLSGVCLACGHDFSGSPSKCPKCGAPTI